MSDVWDRLAAEIERRPEGRGRPAEWLAERLGSRVQRVANWKARGVPADAFEQIAGILGWTMDAVAGRAPPPADPWPFEDVDRAAFDALTERQKGVVEQAMREAIASATPVKRQAGGQ